MLELFPSRFYPCLFDFIYPATNEGFILPPAQKAPAKNAARIKPSRGVPAGPESQKIRKDFCMGECARRLNLAAAWGVSGPAGGVGTGRPARLQLRPLTRQRGWATAQSLQSATAGGNTIMERSRTANGRFCHPIRAGRHVSGTGRHRLNYCSNCA